MINIEGMIVNELKNYGAISYDRKLTTELNKTELEIAKFLGIEKTKIGRKQIKFVDDTWEKHYLAYCGEMAFCKIMNIYHSPLIDPSHNWENDSGDAEWGGKNVDIKHSIHENATLAVQDYAKDYYLARILPGIQTKMRIVLKKIVFLNIY